MFLNSILYKILSRFRAHILVIGCEYNAVFIFAGFSNSLDIDCGSDICTAVAYEYADFLH